MMKKWRVLVVSNIYKNFQPTNYRKAIKMKPGEVFRLGRYSLIMRNNSYIIKKGKKQMMAVDNLKKGLEALIKKKKRKTNGK